MSDGTAFAVVDAFPTEHPFSGNLAGVLLDELPDPGWMQGVADELAQATRIPTLVVAHQRRPTMRRWSVARFGRSQSRPITLATFRFNV
ncbi:hypothetical protein [Blastococcus sp. VKM Ac-2987]|uniref:hypothetical protein n=1 Tax=Blastococcus sp. VKM Ac-2987 TaxID=3004141 RepID=UPI0022AB8AFA|nr:hypothetical protein [Blastococcus sp. VKM Ac-2987]MCZ2857992.1 hypothetical protein [Blastococcus sp. VKM Ac-2987]